jgi:hypothetical protein
MDGMDRRSFMALVGKVGGCAVLGGGLLDAEAQDAATMQKLLDQRLWREHPRLHLRAAQWDTLRTAIQQDPLLGQWYAAVQTEAAKMMTEPPARYVLVGPRLLYQSRIALDHIATLAGLYRLDGDVKKADRARAELRAICAFPTWHPPHFLDVAEMTNAAALGYDWLYDVLSEEERRTLREKIVEFGLRAGLDEYAKKPSWAQPGANNWGQVCNGGLTVGALAIAGDGDENGGKPFAEPAELLAVATSNVRYAMEAYAPDGGWPEGPAYWSYATSYTCFMLSSLNSALGIDFGLSQMKGFSDTGMFRVASIGPTGQTFNYADASPTVDPAPEMLWLAQRFDKPLYAVSEHEEVGRHKPAIFHLVWSRPHESALRAGSPPLDVHFSRIDVAYFRTAWQDPNAFFIGIKGGDNKASHGHLDLGTFVMDADGERWALDLGPDNYDLPGYFGKARFSYYRLRTEAHNTLSFGTANQVMTAKAPLTDYASSPQRGQASIDLSAAYAPQLQRVVREVVLDRSGEPRVELNDSIEGGAGTTLRWNLHTRAQIDLAGNVAMLRKGDKSLRARILSPAGATFSIISAYAPLPQAQQPDVRNLTIEVPLQAAATQIKVEFELA